MPGIFTSKFTGTEIEEAISSKPQVVSSSELGALNAADFNEDKIFILSNNNALYRSNGSIFQRLSNIPYTESAPTSENTDDLKIAFLSSTPAQFYSGWIYVIYTSNGSTYTTQHIYAIIGDKNIVIK